jgi:peptide/nickel transport system substrate-binding protein
MRPASPLGRTLLAASAVVALWAAAERPERGGVLHVAQRAEVKTFNPVIAVDAPSREVLRRMHADLISIDRATQKTVPSLAESWTTSPDGLRYTLKLRKGVRFSDGQPFTADDVIFSWSVYLDEQVRSPQRDLLVIDGKPIEVFKSDGYTVQFVLPKPYAAAERLFDSVAILPRHLLEPIWRNGRLRDAWAVGTPPGQMAGLGPFRLKEYRPGEAIVLERNPYYWQHGLPYLDGIEFRVLADEDVQLARFASGGLDVLNRLSMKSVAWLQGKGAQVTDLGPSLEYNFLCFNLSPDSPKLAWFGSREFRAALSAAVDREGIVRAVFQGRAAPLWSNVSPGNRLWHNDTIQRPPRSLETARELLKAAGYHLDANQRLLDRNGARVEFSILVSTSSAERQQMATMLQSDFGQIGIDVTIAPMEFRSVLDRVLTRRQFDTVLLGLGGGDADPNPELNVWLSSGSMHLWNPNQKQPATAWEHEIDTLMERQIAALNPVERKKLYDRVQDIVAAQLPMIFLVSPNVVVAQRGNVGNFRPAALDHHTLWNAAELYLRRSRDPSH